MLNCDLDLYVDGVVKTVCIHGEHFYKAVACVANGIAFGFLVFVVSGHIINLAIFTQNVKTCRLVCRCWIVVL